jgi:hypothetical protein
MEKTILDLASVHWREGRLREAGRLLFESMPPRRQAEWAGSILKYAAVASRVRHPAVRRLLEIADDPAQWGDGHRAFDALRRAVLPLTANPARSDEEQLLLRLLGLAEVTAKVIYNATDPRDPFDHDAGWWVAETLKAALDRAIQQAGSGYLHAPSEDAAYFASRTAWLTLCGRTRHDLTLSDFVRLDRRATLRDVHEQVGRHLFDAGSGVQILVYPLADGGTVWVSLFAELCVRHAPRGENRPARVNLLDLDRLNRLV